MAISTTGTLRTFLLCSLSALGMVTHKVVGKQGEEDCKWGLKEPGWALHAGGKDCKAARVSTAWGRTADTESLVHHFKNRPWAILNTDTEC